MVALQFNQVPHILRSFRSYSAFVLATALGVVCMIPGVPYKSAAS